MDIEFLNNFGEKINVTMEPEGYTCTLDEGKSILIKPSAKEKVLHIKINKYQGKVNLSIWPNDGECVTVPDIFDMG